MLTGDGRTRLVVEGSGMEAKRLSSLDLGTKKSELKVSFHAEQLNSGVQTYVDDLILLKILYITKGCSWSLTAFLPSLPEVSCTSRMLNVTFS